MMFQLGDDGVVSSVNEDDLIYVDKNELEQFIESYQELEKENEQLKLQLQNTSAQRDEFFRGARENANRVGKLKKENEKLKQYKQSVKDILNDWSNKDLTAHELGIIIAIMKELNVNGDVE